MASRGIEAAASGMIAQQARFEVIANNLANIETPGFRRVLSQVAAGQNRPVYASDAAAASGSLLGALSAGVIVLPTGADLTQGPTRNTGRALDAAITGDAFFAVLANGEPAYTRAGTFQVSPDGTLADQLGNPLVGKSGKAIIIPRDAASSDVRIGQDGEVLAKSNAAGAQYVEIDRLQLARLDAASIQPLGDRLYKGNATPVPAAEVQLQPESVEGSNVNVVLAMAEMIDALRAYETSARMVQALMDVEGKAVNDLRG